MTAFAREMEHWPAYTTPNEKPYTLKHVELLEQTLVFCRSFRTAVQAGGSIGYWPRRMAGRFRRVITFEPEPIIRECLVKNLADHPNVQVRPEALGEMPGRCAIERRGFGSHRVTEGDTTDVTTIDSLGLRDLDLLQLDIEGHELAALRGAARTILLCEPVIQIEILAHPTSADHKEAIEFFYKRDYQLVQQLGRDFVFAPS